MLLIKRTFANQIMEYLSLLFNSNAVPDAMSNHFRYIVTAEHANKNSEY